jgi:mono/diheme cytochrome c family protein
MLHYESHAARLAILAGRACLLALLVLFTPRISLAADATRGQRIAEARCAPCHIVKPHARAELAHSPPFDVIARKYGSNADLIAQVILSPHAGMNIVLSRSEAADLAAYIANLGKP